MLLKYLFLRSRVSQYTGLGSRDVRDNNYRWPRRTKINADPYEFQFFYRKILLPDSRRFKVVVFPFPRSIGIVRIGGHAPRGTSNGNFNLNPDDRMSQAIRTVCRVFARVNRSVEKKNENFGIRRATHSLTRAVTAPRGSAAVCVGPRR